MEAILNFLYMLLGHLDVLGPILIAALTVPIMNGLKRGVTLLDKSPALVKQIVVVLLAVGLSWLGATLNLALPAELSLFSGENVEAILAAAFAMAAHAGKKKTDAIP